MGSKTVLGALAIIAVGVFAIGTTLTNRVSQSQVDRLSEDGFTEVKYLGEVQTGANRFPPSKYEATNKAGQRVIVWVSTDAVRGSIVRMMGPATQSAE